MATIGTQLVLPETGWKRYDDRDPLIIRTKLNDFDYSGGAYYNDTLSYGVGSVSFTFYGSGFRIFTQSSGSLSYNPNVVGDIMIRIDEEIIPNVNLGFNSTGKNVGMLLQYEKLLNKGFHTVTIENKSTNNSWTLSLDCIDIRDGYLVNSNTSYDDMVTSISDIDIKKCIGVDYSYENGFSNILDSYKYLFICVEKTAKKTVFVLNNSIPNISFDEINQKGFIYGNEISHPFGGYFDATVRSMTSAEYNKYIVNSTLGGLITAGDKNIWNWNIASILSSSPTDSSKITTMGGATVSTTNQALTQIVKAATYGFRPILVVDNLRAKPTFTNSTQFGLHGDNLNLAITDISINRNITQEDETFDIFIKDSVGNIIYTKNINVSEGSSFSYVIHKDLLNIANNSFNKLIIEIIDKEGLSYSQKISVAIINNSVYFYDTCYISSDIQNTNLKDNAIIDLEVKGNKVLFVITDNIDYININNLEKANINKKDIKIIAMLDKDSVIESFGLAFVN